jgi:glycosyltransferase involved in cell wall biosynthesis
MKILFFINALEHGGAARVTSVISNELALRGHNVTIMANTLYQKVNYKIDSNVNLVPTFTEKYFKKYPRKIRVLYYYFNIRRNLKKIKPDVIVGVMPHEFLRVFICSLGLSIPVIASDRITFKVNSSLLNYFIRFYIYNFASAVTVLTQVDYDFLGKRLPRKTVMPCQMSYTLFSGQTVRKKTILAAGRLDDWHMKGFDILIEVWARIAKKYPDWTLEIAGDGSDASLSTLQGFVLQYEITDQVNFLGFQTEMAILYQNSAIFILSSRYEGFGNVLIEAMSQGCACIAFELDGRINEIISSSNGGIVLKNQHKDGLEKAIIRLIEDEPLRKSLGEGAKQDAIRFSKDKIVDKWEALFNNVVNKVGIK